MRFERGTKTKMKTKELKNKKKKQICMYIYIYKKRFSEKKFLKSPEMTTERTIDDDIESIIFRYLLQRGRSFLTKYFDADENVRERSTSLYVSPGKTIVKPTE